MMQILPSYRKHKVQYNHKVIYQAKSTLIYVFKARNLARCGSFSISRGSNLGNEKKCRKWFGVAYNKQFSCWEIKRPNSMFPRFRVLLLFMLLSTAFSFVLVIVQSTTLLVIKTITLRLSTKLVALFLFVLL